MRPFILSLFFIFSFFTSLSAKALHLFILGDIKDKSIKKFSLQNIENIEHSFKYIGSECGIPVNVTKLFVDDGAPLLKLTRSSVIRAIRKAPINPDDIVILSYSGHGCREKDSPTIWPSGGFENERRHPTTIVEFSEITRRLLSKKAALYIVLLDCCNTLIPKDLQSPYKPLGLKKLNAKINKKNFEELFLKSYGFVIASGTSPREFGWTYAPYKPEMGMLDDSTVAELPRMGLVFTRSFLNYLFYELQVDHPSWSNIFEKTQKAVFKETQKNNYQPPQDLLDHYKPPHTFQTPQYRVFLHKKRIARSVYKKYLFKDCAYTPQLVKTLTPEFFGDKRESDMYLETPISNIVPKFLFFFGSEEVHASDLSEQLPTLAPEEEAP